MQFIKSGRLWQKTKEAQLQAFKYSFSNEIEDDDIFSEKFDQLKKETPLEKFQTIALSNNSVLQDYVNYSERNLQDFDQYEYIQQIHKSSMVKYVSTLFSRKSFFKDIQQRFTLTPRKDIRKQVYEVLSLEKNLEPMHDFYQLQSDDEYKQLLISQNDHNVLENLRVFFSNMKEPILIKFLNLAASLCEANQSVHILNNITQNLSYILGFCDYVPEKQVEHFVKKVEEQLELNLLLESKEQNELNELIYLVGKIQLMLFNYCNPEKLHFPALIKISKHIVKSDDILKENQQYDFEYNLNLIYVMFFLNKDEVPNYFRLRLLKNFQNYVSSLEQDFIVSILGSLLIKNHNLTQEFADQIMKNPKFTKLQIVDVYIILQSFLTSELDIIPHLSMIYQSFWQNLLYAKYLPDLKIILMASKIQEYVQSSIISTNTIAFDKKTAKLATIIQDSLQKLNLTGKIKEILEISNVFNKTLQKPTYLFQIINYYSVDLVVNKQTVDLLKELLDIQTQRLQPMYFYFFQKRWTSFQQDNQQFNSDNKPLITQIGQAIRTSELIFDPLIESYITLLGQKNFFKNDKTEENKQLIQFLYQWLQNYEKQDINIEFLAQVMQFLKHNSIDSSLRINVLAKYFDLYSNSKEQFKLSQLLKFYYETIQAIQSFQNADVQAVKEVYFNKLKQDFKKIAVPLINQNSKYTVQKVQGENFSQSFLQSQMIEDLKNIEYILPILDQLKISFHGQMVIDQIINQIKRVCKSWAGPILAENLILLDKNNITVFNPVYLFCAENLTSCFYFDPEDRAFIPMLTFDQTLQLLRVYLRQFKWLSGRQINELKYYKNSLRILTYFADVVYSKLTVDEIITIFEIVGYNDVNYWPPFLKKIQSEDFQLGANFIQQMAQLPNWIKNNAIEKKLFSYLGKKRLTNITPQLVKALQNLSIFYSPVQENKMQIESFFKNNFQKNLLGLEYIRSCSNLEDPSIKNLLKTIQLSDQDTIQDQLNYAIILTIASLKKMIKILPTSQDGQAVSSFKVEVDRKLPPNIDDEKKQILENIKEIVLHKQQKTFVLGSDMLDQYELRYYETMNSMESYLYNPNWKVFPCYPEGDAQPINQFYEFIVNQTQQEEEKFVTQSMHYLQILYTHWFEENTISPHILEASENLQRIRLNRQRQNENYISFLISLTLAIPNHQTYGYKFSYKNGYHCPKTKIILDLAIFRQSETETRQIGIIFTSQDDLIQEYQENGQCNNFFLSPIGLLKSYLLTVVGDWDVYYVVQQNWTQVYDNRKKQEKFIHSIIGI